MKHSIHGFMQQEAVNLGVSHDDLLLLRWFVDFKDTGAMKAVIVGGVPYYWVRYDYIIKQLPVLGMQKQTIARRFKALVAVGVLLHHHGHELNGERGSFSLYAIGPKYGRLVFQEDHLSNLIDPPINSDRPPSINSDRPLYQKRQTKDSSINIHLSDNSINNVIPIFDDEDSTSPPPQEASNHQGVITPPSPPAELHTGQVAGGSSSSDAFDEFWRAWPNRVAKAAARKAFKKALEVTTLEAILQGVARYIQNKPAYADYCHPSTWLNQERWEDAPASGYGVGKTEALPNTYREDDRQAVAGDGGWLWAPGGNQ